MIFWITFSAFVCAAIPAALFCVNLWRYRAPSLAETDLPKVSILIPARNEAIGIEAAIRSALRSAGCKLEVVVIDDGSTDDTAKIVEILCAEDSRVRLEKAPPLPPGWNGKQHACWCLAKTAQYELLCFVDADVRLEPTCVERMASFLQDGNKSLVSGFPRQQTITTLEWLLLPLIHFVLLGFLPMGKMRSGTNPSYAAGCGQFMMVRAEDYFTCGGHSNIRQTMHDGLRLPKLFREASFRTDLADLTVLASCRMYRSSAEVWYGLAKNATEGLGDPKRIGPVSLALLLGQVLPFVTIFLVSGWARWLCVGAIIAAWLPRWLAAWRFKQDWRGALLHPVGILLLLSIQWYALLRKVRGRAVSWRDRAYVGS
jgi:glycosyltransferase involved in cell wall biosynthesis